MLYTSAELREWDKVLRLVKEQNLRIAFDLNDVRDGMRRHCKSQKYETPFNFKQRATRIGWAVYPKRLRFRGSLSTVVLSPEIARDGAGSQSDEVRIWVKPIAEVLGYLNTL